ncbi:MAG: helix-turn-helix transcriptional regulator [Chloroflexota bacterium]
MTEPRTDDPALARAALLLEPVRRRLYEFVVENRGAVDRDAAAAGTGIGRPLAAFHLDRLAEAGLLEVEFRRRSGRTGPGAGRPAKFCRASAIDAIEVSVPARRYRFAAELFAEGLEGDAAGREAVLDAARERGRAVGRGVADGGAVAALRELGYSPVPSDDGTIQLANCPFRALVGEHRNVICATNLALLGGLVESLPRERLRAERHDAEGRCCVDLVPD